MAPVGSGNDFALSPAPSLGFSGAAAQDSDGKFAAIALLKPVIVAGPPNAAAAAQAALRRMQAESLIAENAAPAGTPVRRARRVYQLTEAGRRRFAELRHLVGRPSGSPFGEAESLALQLALRF